MHPPVEWARDTRSLLNGAYDARNPAGVCEASHHDRQQFVIVVLSLNFGLMQPMICSNGIRCVSNPHAVGFSPKMLKLTRSTLAPLTANLISGTDWTALEREVNYRRLKIVW